MPGPAPTDIEVPGGPPAPHPPSASPPRGERRAPADGLGRPDTASLRILVAIANHGVGNAHHARHLIEVYRRFAARVDIVVLSDVPKDFGPDVAVRVGLPSADPWSLPFAHRPLFLERQDDYDIFIYSEDDTEFTEANLEAFLEATRVLPEDCIAGFLRYEKAPDGRTFYSTMHGPYHWDPASIVTVGGEVYARYTNDHAACYVLTREQLKRCIASGGYAVAPHAGRYDMLVSAATDPYARCGLRKMICVSRIDRFLLHHLPDKYLGRIGIARDEIDAQIERILSLARARPRPADGGSRLITPRTAFDTIAFDKNYAEPVRTDVVALVPPDGRDVLSVGCERGLTETRLARAGYAVHAIALDPVIAVSARAQGVTVLAEDVETGLSALSPASFDCIVLNNVLSYVADADALLARLRPALRPGGAIVVGFDNARSLPVMRRFWRTAGPDGLRALRKGYGAARYRPLTAPRVRHLLRCAGFRPDATRHRASGRWVVAGRAVAGLADPWLAASCAVRGRAPDGDGRGEG
jgi:SAM-dependent methyltransferase